MSHALEYGTRNYSFQGEIQTEEAFHQLPEVYG